MPPTANKAADRLGESLRNRMMKNVWTAIAWAKVESKTQNAKLNLGAYQGREGDHSFT